MSSSVRCVAWTMQLPVPERAVLVEQLSRRAAVGGEAGLVLGALLGQVRVQRRAPLARPLRDGRELIGRHRADGVDRGADAGVRRVAQRRCALGPRLRIAVGEALLNALGRQCRTRSPGSTRRAA